MYDIIRHMILNMYVSKSRAVVFDRENGVKVCKLHTSGTTLKLIDAG